MSQEPSSISSLGALDRFPLELRTEIYIYALCFNDPSETDASQCRNRAALLRTSKAIHAETEKIIYRVNEFELLLEEQENEEGDDEGNYWIVKWQHAHLDNGAGFVGEHHPRDFFSSIIWHKMIGELRHVDVIISRNRGISENYFFSKEAQKNFDISDPEDWNYHFCFMTTVCGLIHYFLEEQRSNTFENLTIQIWCTKDIPSSIGQLLDAFNSLRGVRHACLEVFGVNKYEDEDSKIVWRLKESYATYFKNALESPKGAKMPKYLEVPEGSEASEDSDEELDEDSDESDVSEMTRMNRDATGNGQRHPDFFEYIEEENFDEDENVAEEE